MDKNKYNFGFGFTRMRVCSLSLLYLYVYIYMQTALKYLWNRMQHIGFKTHTNKKKVHLTCLLSIPTPRCKTERERTIWSIEFRHILIWAQMSRTQSTYFVMCQTLSEFEMLARHSRHFGYFIGKCIVSAITLELTQYFDTYQHCSLLQVLQCLWFLFFLYIRDTLTSVFFQFKFFFSPTFY